MCSDKCHNFQRERKKKLLDVKCVFSFSLQFLSETFLILRTERDIIKMCNGLHVKYPLFLYEFNEIWIFPTDFLKYLVAKLTFQKLASDRSQVARKHLQQMLGSGICAQIFVTPAQAVNPNTLTQAKVIIHV
jgi:hypothetical protein